MEEWITALKDVLTAEKNAYCDLLSLSEKKKDILIINDLPGLNEIIRQETAIMRDIKPLAVEREALSKKIRERYGLTNRESIDDAISLAKGRLKDELTALKKEYGRIIKKLSDSNALNRKLLETQMQYTTFCIGVLTQNGNSSDIYNGSGGVTEDQSSRFGLIDQKI